MPRIVVDPWLIPWMTHLPPFQMLPQLVWGSTATMCEFEMRPVNCPSFTAVQACRLLRRDVLLCAGLAMAPSTSPADTSAWGFLIEHAGSIADRNGRLRVVDAATDWDSRAKGLFAERMGLGLALWLLWRRFQVVHVADAAPFIATVLQDPTSPYHGSGLHLIGTNGAVRPDFFCLTGGSEVVVAESKGAIGPPSAVSSAEKQKAKQQTQNVQPIGVPLRVSENRLVFATTLRTASETARANKDTGVHVEDPEGADEPVPIRVSADAIVVNAYSKVLQLAGLGLVALSLQRGHHPLMPPQVPTLEFEGESLVLLGSAFGMHLTILTSVAKSLLNEPFEGVAARVSRALHESRLAMSSGERTPEAALVLPNGVVALATL